VDWEHVWCNWGITFPYKTTSLWSPFLFLHSYSQISLQFLLTPIPLFLRHFITLIRSTTILHPWRLALQDPVSWVSFSYIIFLFYFFPHFLIWFFFFTNMHSSVSYLLPWLVPLDELENCLFVSFLLWLNFCWWKQGGVFNSCCCLVWEIFVCKCCCFWNTLIIIWINLPCNRSCLSLYASFEIHTSFLLLSL